MQATQLVHAMRTDPGLIRRGNEDACDASPEHGIYVVCDGMGGAAAGEVASHLATQTVLDHVAASAGRNDHRARLNEAVHAANHAVFQKSLTSPELAGMGTTLVALLHTPAETPEAVPEVQDDPGGVTLRPRPPSLWLVHVGDSRCYRLRGRDLALLTSDHSLVEEQVRAGHITPAEAAVSPMRNYITRAVGSMPEVDPEVQAHRPHPGDIYLLASDGLTTELTNEEIAGILEDIPNPPTAPYLAAACDTLIRAAKTCGGRDNITVLLLAFAV
ncbi:MAG: serine/threonine-protein phosphatase [Acidobacteriota bacterium]|nr:serine/threonine-protein phosphatase [Acidobacteriota bacterium]